MHDGRGPVEHTGIHHRRSSRLPSDQVGVGLGVDLIPDSPVRAATRIGDHWRIVTDRETVDAADLVLAIDAPAAAALLAKDPDLADVALPLRTVELGDVAVVTLLVDLPLLDDDVLGSGVLVAPGNGRVRAKAMTHGSAKWAWVREALGPGRHVVRLSYGRDGQITEPIDALPDIAAADLAAILDLTSVPVAQAEVTRWSRTLVRPWPGYRARAASVAAAATAAPHLAVVGAGLGGNSLAGTIGVARTVLDQLPA